MCSDSLWKDFQMALIGALESLCPMSIAGPLPKTAAAGLTR